MIGQSIGQSVPRVDAIGKVTGATHYPGDLVIENMLHMKVLFSEKAHARIVSLDVSEAEEVPGVEAIFTARDVPVNEYGLIMFDQPVLCGPDSSKADGDIVRTTMDNIALIVAETEDAAARARDLIRVDYEELEAVFDPYEAMKPEAPQLHANSPDNIIVQYRIRKGDMASGWEAADVIVEGTYNTTWQEHAYLQPEAGLAYIDEEGRVTVEAAGQWTHEDQEQICHALNLPAEQVRVIYPGKVVFAAPFEGYGPTVVVQHAGRVFTLYAGLSSIAVKRDDLLSLRQSLGRAGERLYFEIRVENKPEDPRRWVR